MRERLRRGALQAALREAARAGELPRLGDVALRRRDREALHAPLQREDLEVRSLGDGDGVGRGPSARRADRRRAPRGARHLDRGLHAPGGLLLPADRRLPEDRRPPRRRLPRPHQAPDEGRVDPAPRLVVRGERRRVRRARQHRAAPGALQDPRGRRPLREGRGGRAPVHVDDDVPHRRRRPRQEHALVGVLPAPRERAGEPHHAPLELQPRQRAEGEVVDPRRDDVLGAADGRPEVRRGDP